MKKISITINVLLVAAVIVLAVLLAKSNSCANGSANGGNEAIDNIMTRTSIRAYDSEKPVEKEKVETLLRAAMAAPTAQNKQPWDFIVADNAETIKLLADSMPNNKMLRQATLAIVVCGNMQKTIEGGGRDFWIQDVSASTENLLLAANALGLGAVWVGVFPVPERVKTVQNVLGLPSYIIPLSLIPIGYPAENPDPKDKWKEENVHYNGWNNAQ